MKSSTTTSAPESPNRRRSTMSITASTASASVAQTTAPLPAARPEALTTIGAPRDRMQAMASALAVKLRWAAVGTPMEAIRPFEKLLLLSMRAAASVGPKASSPAAAKRSTKPAARAASGPTTVRSIPSSAAKTARRSISPSRRGRSARSRSTRKPGRHSGHLRHPRRAGSRPEPPDLG